MEYKKQELRQMEDRFKFRGRRYCGEWVYGGVHCNESGEICITDNHGYCWIIDPNTAGQCTGLKDKNDTLIYEGDILLQGGNFRLVKWCIDDYSIGTGWGVVDNSTDDDFPYAFENDNSQVIGNLHQNPELLQDGE